jgi:cell division protein ZapB
MILDEQELGNLELRLDELLQIVRQLKNENHSLRESQTSLLNERSRLIEKTELARSRVEAMIERLKAMEKEA